MFYYPQQQIHRQQASPYAKTTLVVVIEAVKIVVAFVLLASERGQGIQEAWSHVCAATFQQPAEVRVCACSRE